jgi:hypothetical protein
MKNAGEMFLSKEAKIPCDKAKNIREVDFEYMCSSPL